MFADNAPLKKYYQEEQLVRAKAITSLHLVVLARIPSLDNVSDFKDNSIHIYTAGGFGSFSARGWGLQFRTSVHNELLNFRVSLQKQIDVLR